MLPVARPIDEFLLAAYLSRGLPPSMRQEIECYLLESEDARDILRMATEALEELAKPRGSQTPAGQRLVSHATERKDSLLNSRQEPHGRSAQMYSSIGVFSGVVRKLRRPVSAISGTIRGIILFSLAAVTLSAFIWNASGRSGIPGAVLAPGHTPDLSQSAPSARAASSTSIQQWTAVLSNDQETVAWPALPGASSYALVVLNVVDNSILNLVSTSDTWIPDLHAAAFTFKSAHAGPLSIWIVALDRSGNFIQTSNSLALDIAGVSNPTD